MRPKGTDTTPTLYSDLRFAAANESSSMKPEAAGYMQVRISTHGPNCTIERIDFDLGGIISGLKP